MLVSNFKLDVLLYKSKDFYEHFTGGTPENPKEGYVEMASLQAVIREFGMTIKVPRLYEELDKDKDGKLSYTEFAAMFQ